MVADIKTTKKEINSFLLINFGLIAFISIFIFLSLSKPNSSEFIINFGGLFMYVPAFSVIVVLKRISNYDFNPTVEKFFKVFAITTIVRGTVSIIEVFFINSIMISSIIDTVISLYLICMVLYNESQFEVLNLSLTKNFKKIFMIILIFVGIIVIRSFIDNEGMSTDTSSNIAIAIMSLIMNFLFGFNLFFGEEFGWRYFLQPRLQKIYGKRIGVIILGFIWGIWHLPLCFTLYSPETPMYCVISHIAFCTSLGVFLGYAYMKTGSIWAPILIHLVNNVVAVIVGGGYESTISLEGLLFGILINAIVFLPFLFAKEYKNNKVDESSTLDI